MISFAFLRPLIIGASKRRYNNEPVLYHIEPCTDPNCYGWDRSSPTDVPLGHYMNLERLRSTTFTSRTLSSNTNPYEPSMVTTRTDCLSFLSSRASSHMPLVHASVSRIGMLEREGTIGNSRIQPPTRSVIEEETRRPCRRSNTTVIVSRVKSSHRKTTFSDISLDDLSNGRTPTSHRNRIQVTRVHSLPSNPIPFALDDDTNTKCTPQFPTIKSESSPKPNRSQRTLQKFRSKSLRTSAKGSIRVERVPLQQRQTRREQFTPLSLISTETQKRTISQHSTIRVERIPRTKTA